MVFTATVIHAGLDQMLAGLLGPIEDKVAKVVISSVFQSLEAFKVCVCDRLTALETGMAQ